MRTKVLFDNIDASQTQTSDVIIFQQRGEWMLQIEKTGTNGTPKIIIEFSIDDDQLIWTPIENNFIGEFYFLLDDSPIGIKDDRLPGQFYRIRLEPEDNTIGTIKAILGYKTYP